MVSIGFGAGGRQHHANMNQLGSLLCSVSTVVLSELANVYSIFLDLIASTYCCSVDIYIYIFCGRLSFDVQLVSRGAKLQPLIDHAKGTLVIGDLAC